MWRKPQETADLVTFSEEILRGKLHFLSVIEMFAPWLKLHSRQTKFQWRHYSYNLPVHSNINETNHKTIWRNWSKERFEPI